VGGDDRQPPASSSSPCGEHDHWEQGSVQDRVTVSGGQNRNEIVNVALYREYSPGIVFIFSQGRKDLYNL
jgi:hypothetical protein